MNLSYSYPWAVKGQKWVLFLTPPLCCLCISCTSIRANIDAEPMLNSCFLKEEKQQNSAGLVERSHLVQWNNELNSGIFSCIHKNQRILQACVCRTFFCVFFPLWDKVADWQPSVVVYMVMFFAFPGDIHMPVGLIPCSHFGSVLSVLLCSFLWSHKVNFGGGCGRQCISLLFNTQITYLSLPISSWWLFYFSFFPQLLFLPSLEQPPASLWVSAAHPPADGKLQELRKTKDFLLECRSVSLHHWYSNSGWVWEQAVLHLVWFVILTLEHLGCHSVYVCTHF